jgi:predicted Zn-dependent protease
MLFDLRGRGRRGAVRVIYAGLAVLFGSGLVLFGVGGFGGTGILSSLSKSEEGGGSSGYSKQIAKYRKLTEKQPSDASAWENLAKYLYHQAGEEPYTTSAGEVTSKGKEYFKEVSHAWASYMALNPKKPNLELAKEMASVYGEGGLEESSKAVEALQVVIAAEPTSASWYAQLAEYAYKAKNTSLGDLASEKAVALSPAADRERVKAELAEVKANPSGEKTYTTTTNGKTYTGKLNSKGEIKADEVASKGKTSTKK